MRIIVSMIGLFFFGSFSLIFAAHGPADALSGLAGSGACPRTGAEIVFIDPSVMDAEEIIDDLGENAEVVRLTSGKNGVEEICDYLEEKENIAAIRIITHGNAGYFVLNKEIVHSYFVADNGDRIMAWGNALAEGGDILLYGCNLAATARGQALVAQIAELTGADVAAATLPTGGDMGSGKNWDLDYHCGTIETAAVNIQDYPYHLANQVVTNNSDSGAGSLRQAIADVGSGEEITFDGDYTITLSSELHISKDLTITGQGAGSTIVQASATEGTATNRVLTIAEGATVTIEDLTIRHGVADGNPARGGGIHNLGTCTIERVAVAANHARGDGHAYGGGICNSGTLTMIDSTITGNTAEGTDSEKDAYGGGIFTDSACTLTLSGCLIDENSATGGDSDGMYGGSAFGGGIGTPYPATGTMSVVNCTIFGNSVFEGSSSMEPGQANGGGIYANADDSFSFCTIAGNSARAGGGILTMLSDDNHGPVLKACIVADNSASVHGPDIYGRIQSRGYNLIENTTDLTLDIAGGDGNTGAGNITGVDPALSALADNGGPTRTMAIAADSQAREAADTNTDISGTTITTDQRGFDRNGVTDNDIGAFEYLAPTVTTQAATEIGLTSATGNDTITDLGYENPTQHGVCWSTSENPTTAGSHTEKGAASETGAFTSDITGLLPGTTYYVRAYATNAYGTAYGDQVSFATRPTTDTTTADGNWSAADTWTDARVPLSTQNVIIAHNATLDTDAEIQDLTVGSGGTLTIDGTNTLTVTGELDASDGAINFAGAGTPTIDGTAACGALGTFACGTGTVYYSADAAQSIDDVAYYNLTLSGSGTKTLCGNASAGSNLTVSDADTTLAVAGHTMTVEGVSDINGTLTISTGTYDANGIFDATGGSVTFTGAGNLRLGNTMTSLGTFTAGTGTITYDGTDQPIKNSSSDSITYYAIVLSGSGTKTFSGTTTATGGITIDADLTVRGDGAGSTIVQASATEGTATDRVFTIDSGATVTIEDLTIRHGKAPNGAEDSDGEDGGGINNQGTLTINNCIISNNTSGAGGVSDEDLGYFGGCGGGIYTAGALTISNCTISYNQLGAGGEGDEQDGYAGSGGGIYCSADGSLTITGSLIESNNSDCVLERVYGGGIYSAGDLTISGSTIRSNRADSYGAGIYCESANSTITTSTINNNTYYTSSYHGTGGGIALYSPDGSTASLTLTNCTIRGNTATGGEGYNGGGGVSLRGQSGGSANAVITNCAITANSSNGAGDGIFLYTSGNSPMSYANVTLKNTIVAGNNPATAGEISHYGNGTETLTTQGYNIIGDNDGDLTLGTFPSGLPNGNFDYVGTHASYLDPLLATLADNGGPTQTMALESGSFAIDAIPYADAGSGVWNGSPTQGGNYYDQRGVEIPAGTAISIGAYSEPPAYYMAKSDGNWSSVAIWYTNMTGGTDPGDYTTAATEAPNADNSDGIFINSNVTVDADVTIDQTTVNSGTTLTVNTGVTLTVADGDGTDLTIDGTLDGDGNLDINGSISISATGSVDSDGTFDATGGEVTFTGAGHLYLGGTITSLGTFTCGTGTVTLDGASQSLPAGYTFYNLTKTVSSADTLTFQAGSTTTVTNTLTLQGADGARLSLRSSSDGDQWEIDPRGARTVAYLDVKDSNNTSGTPIDTAGTNSIDSGLNTGWTFQLAPAVTTQPVTDTRSSSATGNGDISVLGIPNPTAHGVVWNTAGAPTLADNSTDEGAVAATGAFTTNMTGLTPNTTCAVRAYATNAEDTAYGEELSFTTLPSTLAPVYFLLNEDEQDPNRQR